ncbi:carboxypeptidase regulatory-like domain-containing protein [Cystobacter fuscus]|uniref:carboxypeptidase regulatory-like domain-containing protein n=1 Tax=Cystobacter fuscus TaxID=43 RepID=UPI0018DEFBC2|nr:carboxypeptidase regulatory-like domain-containing protein [Cystobacter fuscus]
MSTTSGQALAGATVSATPQQATGEPSLARADGQGRWALCQLPGGSYALSATAPGYRPAQRLLAVSPLGPPQTVDFQLQSGGVELRGTVLDVGGGPIAGARVVAVEQVPAPEFGRTGPRPASWTDANGQYQLWLDAGVYGLTASHPDYTDGAATVRMENVPRKQDFLLTPAASIQGRVLTREGGHPVAGARVSWSLGDSPKGSFSLDAELPPAVLTDDSGNFVIRQLPSGRVRLRATSPGFLSEPVPVDLGIAAQARDIVLLVDRALSISGQVVQKGSGTPVAGAHVSALHTETQESARESTPSDEQGAFQLLVPGAGRYRLITTGGNFVPRLLSPMVTVKDTSVTDVRVEVDTGATVRGRVEPAAEAWITIEPRRESQGSMLTAMTVFNLRTRSTREGAFELSGVPPGAFTLVATTLEGGRGSAQVDVGSGDPEHTLIQVSPGGRIEGRVVDEQGRAVPNVSIRAVAEPRGQGFEGRLPAGISGGMSEEDGHFRLTGLAAASYRLEAEDSTGALEVRAPTGGSRILLAAGQHLTGQTVVVESRGCGVLGRIQASTGGAQPDAWVSVKPAAAAGRSTQDPARVALSGPDGSFQMEHLRCGAYEIAGFAPETGEQGLVRSELRQGRQERLEVRLVPGLKLRGSVRRAGSPVRQFVLTAQGPSQYQFQGKDGSGEFSIPGVVPGRYSIGVTSDEGSALRTVEVGIGSTPVELELVPWGSVSGTVLDAATHQPLQGYDVLVKSESGVSTFDNVLALISREGPRTDAQGRFLVQRLPSGPNRLLVISGSAERFQILASRTFSLQPGEQVQLGVLEASQTTTPTPPVGSKP